VTRLLGAIGFAVLVAHSRPAHSCSRLTLEPHTTQPDEAAADSTAPEPPRITGVTVDRSYGPRSEGCSGGSESSCDGTGTIGFELAEGADDRTTPDQLGYRIERVAGDLPTGVVLPGAVRAHDGWLWLEFTDPGPDDQDEIDVTFRIVAVDLAGNESAPSARARARDPGDEGCALARGRGGSAGPLMALALAGWIVRRAGRDRWTRQQVRAE
jgi:hypothetical protein